MKTLKVGIAGYGVVGKRRRKYIDEHPNLTTVAVCDQFFQGKGTMDDGVRYYPSYLELLEEDLDILFVSLPNYIAAEVTVAGLKKNLHVFCEKPPGRTPQDIKNVIEVERQHPELKLKYGFNHRYHLSVQAALKMIQSGELGNIVNLRGVYGKSKIISFASGWRAEREFSGGGILLDQGIHMVDLMKLFCGDFDEVKSFVSNQYWNHDVEDNAYAIMRDQQGRVAMLHSSATEWEHGFSLEITLTKGYMKLKGLLTGSKSYGEETLLIGKKVETDQGTLEYKQIKYLEDNSWKDEIDEFAASIIDNGKEILHGSSQEALSTMNLVYKIYCADSQWQEQFNISM